jgi:hypothetical protein
MVANERRLIEGDGRERTVEREESRHVANVQSNFRIVQSLSTVTTYNQYYQWQKGWKCGGVE